MQVTNGSNEGEGKHVGFYLHEENEAEEEEEKLRSLEPY